VVDTASKCAIIVDVNSRVEKDHGRVYRAEAAIRILSAAL
jgi:hypothetical protein